MSFISEFKKFALRGNVVDLAVGIIIGAAFGKIVSSLVGDMIMPPIGILLGGVDFSDLAITLKSATANTPAVAISYGRFIQTIIDFLIIAFAIFMLVKIMSKLERKKAEETPPPPALTKDQELLTDIINLLKDKK